MPNNKKKWSSFFGGKLMLALVVMLSCLAHVNFFMHDMRPFQDHDWYYLMEGHMMFFIFVFDFLCAFLDKFLPFVVYDGFFLYKMINLMFLVPLIVFTYLTAEYLYNKWAGVLAAFIVVTFPQILNVFHKSEINILTAALFSACIFFYCRSNNLKNKIHSLMFVFFLVLFAMHHYSFFLYLAAALPVVFILFVIKTSENHKTEKYFFCLAFLLFFALGLSFLMLLSHNMFFLSMGLSLICMYLLRHMYESESFSLRRLGTVTAIVLSAEILLLSFDFERIYDVFFSTGYVYRYLDGNSFSLMGMLKSFGSIFLREMFSFYRTDLVYLDFSFCLIVFCLSLNVFFLYRSFSEKCCFSKTEIIEISFTCFILLGFLFLSAGVGKAVKFFAPFYMLLAVLLSGVLLKAYHVLRLKIVFWLLVLCLLVSGFVSLFYPNVLVREKDNAHDFYYYMSDGYNADVVLELSRKRNINILSGLVMFTASSSLDEMDLDFVYMWLRLGGRLKQFFSPVKDMKYTHVFFFLYFNDVSDKMSLADIQEQAFFALKEKNEYAEYDALLLQDIIPYGKSIKPLEQNKDSDFLYPALKAVKRDGSFSREFLLFVYKVK